MLQTFGYVLIYSYSLWTTYDNVDISFMHRDDYIVAIDALGGILGGMLGGWVGAITGSTVMSAAARSDVDNGRICLCDNHPNSHEPTCVHCKKKSILQNNYDNELKLTDEALEMLEQLSADHPSIPL